ncbi:MAG: CHAT domain-containing protein [Acidobacteriota bacterium]
MRSLTLAFRFLLVLVCAISLSLLSLDFISRAQDNKPRRPLPKPPSGSRGFEQTGRDASSRLIAAGATRGPLKPIAPYEGLAYNARPFFAWASQPGAASYHLTLREGAESSSPIVYEADVKVAQFSYPPEAPALEPGKLYSWRVSTAGVMEKRQGAVATFFVLAGEDAAQIKTVLDKAKLSAPKTAAERLAQAHIFEDYGVWYDTLRIASELLIENPNNPEAKAYYDSLIQKLKEEANKAAGQSSNLSFPLWQQLRTLVAAQKEDEARSVIKSNRVAARFLYRELLFETVAARLYESPPLKNSEQVRKLLVEGDEQNGALEAKLSEWLKERKLGVGFLNGDEGIEQVLYLIQVAHLRNAEKEPGKDAPPGTPRELTERALEISEAEGIELAVASFSGTLSFYALRDRRMDEINPPLDRAEATWKKWNDTVGLYQAALIRAYAAYALENWKAAATFFARAAELAKPLPELRRGRVNALSMQAAALRNVGDKETVLAALQAAVNEQQQVLQDTTGEEPHLNESKTLAALQTQLGGAIAALGRHVEGGEWYTRAERLRDENYRVEKAQVEKKILDTTRTMQARIDASTSAEYRKAATGVIETFTDSMLSYLDGLASARDDLAEVARIADARLALARRGGDPDKIAHGLEQTANAYRKAGDYARARAAGEEALTLRTNDPRRRWIYETLFLLAQIADDADDWNGALARYRQVIEQTKPGLLPSIYDLNAEPREDLRPLEAHMNNIDFLGRASKAFDAKAAIGRILARQGNYRAADQEYQGVLGSITQLYAIGAPDEAELLSWLRASRDVKSVDIATHRRQTGVTPSKDELERFNLATLMVNSHRSTVLTNLAMLYEEENDLDNAVKAYEQANALSSNLVGGSFFLSGTYVALARIERERGNYAAAEAPIEAALAEFVRKNEAWGIANMLLFKSALRRDQGRLAESKQLAEDALKIAQPLGSRPQTAAILRTLGRAESEQGGASLKSSEQHLRGALATWRDLGLRGHIAYTLDSLGLTLERLGRDEEALAAYIEAVGIVETLAGSLSTNVTSETFNASRGNRELYDHLIKLLIKKGRSAEALLYLERAKSKALVDALAGANIKAKDPQVSALLDRLREQTDALRVAERELASELAKAVANRDQTKITAARAKLAAAQQNYLDAVEKVKRANPSYASMVAVNPTDLVEVRKLLPEKTLLLEYFPTDNELYIFVVTRDTGPAIRTVAIKRTELAKLVMQYREALSSASEQSVLERSARGALWKDDGKPDFKSDIAPIKDATIALYKALIEPAQAEVDSADTLLIVPGGELYYLPIHALARLNQDGSLNFLIEQKRFAYLASADSLNFVARLATVDNTQGSTRPLLAMGNPDGTLPAATEEVNSLGRIFVNANIILGKDATVSRVAQSTAGISYMHFATHGIINSLDPKESYLLLAGDPGRLSVKDIVEDNYKLSFTGTRLVTLSACDTSIGGYDPSAVYSSLSRAFSKAGAPTVVASLWSVNDNSTKDTMTAFYKEIAAGQSKGEAMRRAQLAVMHDPRFAHPYYWAPFIVLGDWK